MSQAPEANVQLLFDFHRNVGDFEVTAATTAFADNSLDN
jgi:hypothetical protein